MEFSSSSSGCERDDCELTCTQVEVLGLLERVVHLLASNASTNIRNLKEFGVIIRRLCEEAPETADAFATTIQETRSSINDFVQQEQDAVEESASRAPNRQRVSGRDLSYRPPKSAKAKAAELSTTGHSDPLENGETQVGLSIDNSAARGTQSSVQNAGAIVEQDKNVGVDQEASSEGDSALQPEAFSQPDQQQCIVRDGVVPKGKSSASRQGSPTEASQDMKESIETTEDTSACSRVKNRRANILPRPATPRANTDPVVFTPTKPMADALATPQTEEILRETISASLESISSSDISASRPFSLETIPLTDLVVEAVRVIHQFQQIPTYSPPRGPFENPADSPESRPRSS
ncbi:hypothetical protein MMC13_005911 [Lambiella insularis]|nr:hypothetical protein [Lambiella insularis]